MKRIRKQLSNEDSIGSSGMGNNISLARHTFYCRIRVTEVKKALKRMKTEKAAGLNAIAMEAWKYLGEFGSLVR